MATVLVELVGGEGVVRRGDGEIVVIQNVTDDGGQPLRPGDQYRPVKIWLDGHRSLVGGLLPPGAVSVEVIDDRGARVAANVGGGAYAAVLDQEHDGHDPVVCCRDAAGTPVRRPLPADYPCAPVPDAEEPCPACGAIDYEECVPTERWRAGRPGPDGTTIPGPIVVCRRCGHEEEEGSIMRLTPPDYEDETARAHRLAHWRTEAQVQRWYSNKLLLSAVTFPIYAAEGWPAQINGSGSRGDELTELTIAHTDNEEPDLFDVRPRLEVTTSTEAPHNGELAFSHQKLEHWIDHETRDRDSPELSDAAITLWFRAVRRRRRAAALGGIRSDAWITIDGTPKPFLTLTSPGGRWVAVRRHDDVTVTIAAHDLDPTTLVLEPIADWEARLLGPEPDEP